MDIMKKIEAFVLPEKSEAEIERTNQTIGAEALKTREDIRKMKQFEEK